MELPAGADVELGEHLAEVVLGGAGADEELRTDLWVGVACGRQASDLRLLCREDVVRVHGALPHRLARRLELEAGPPGERLRPEPAEHVVRRAQVLAGVHPPLLAPEPLAVHEVGAGEVDGDAGLPEAVDRLLVERVGLRALAQQRS